MNRDKRIALILGAVSLLLFAFGGSGGNPFTPAPISEPGLHVLIVETTDDRGTIDKGQLAVLQSTLIKQEVAAAGGQFRQYDADHAPELEPWKTAMSRPRTSTPWLIASNPGKGGFEGPVPSGDGAIDATTKIIGGLK